MPAPPKPPPEPRQRVAAGGAAGGSPLVRPALWALVGVSLVFGLHEVIARTLLRAAPMGIIHASHMMRGLLSAFVAAGAMGWGLFRHSPRLLAPGVAGQEHEVADDADKYRRYALWFIQMRWIAVVVATMLVVVSAWVVHMLPERVGPCLLVSIAALVVVNLVHGRLVQKEAWCAALLQVQVYGDLVVLTVLIHLSGGIENPLAMLFMLHVIIAGILLNRRQCYLVAAASTGLFALMAMAEWGQIVAHYTLEVFPHGPENEIHAAHDSLFVLSRVSLQAVLALLIAYFVTSMEERTRGHERRLAGMARRLVAERQLLDRALETTKTALRVVNRQLEPEWTSTRYQQWFGAEGDGNVGAGDALLRRVLAGGRPQVVELGGAGESDAHQPAAAARTYQLTLAPLLGQDGAVRQVVELVQDVTQQKRSQAQMIRAGKMAAVGELAGQIAHEVNNPIAIISAKARLLLSARRPELSDKVAAELGKIVHCSDRVAAIAQGLLSYCRPSSAARELLDIRSAIRNALGMVAERARNGGIEVVDEIDARLPKIAANGGEIEQVFLNLLLNALDAMPQGGRLRLWSTVSRSDGSSADHEVPIRAVEARETRHGDRHGPAGRRQVSIAVEDTGNGIAEDLRERIWEPFFTTKPEGRGTGLGLSICQGLVRSHGGSITVEPGAGGGSRFLVRLPVTHHDDGAGVKE